MSICRLEGSLRIPGVSATYCTRLLRVCRGKRDRSVACLAESFLGGGLHPSGPVREAIEKFTASGSLPITL